MKIHPTLMSGPMVRALLADRKSLTRRIVSLRNSTVLGDTSKALWAHLHHWERARVDGPPDPFGGGDGYQYLHVPASHPEEPPESESDWCWYRVRPRIVPGDVLLIRETLVLDPERGWRYAADRSPVQCPHHRLEDMNEWLSTRPARKTLTPSIHMPAWACRLWLKVTSVGASRVQDISAADALRCGLIPFTKDGTLRKYWATDPADHPVKGLEMTWQDMPRDPIDALWALWESIHGPGAWERNDWVWNYSFALVERPEGAGEKSKTGAARPGSPEDAP